MLTNKPNMTFIFSTHSPISVDNVSIWYVLKYNIVHTPLQYMCPIKDIHHIRLTFHVGPWRHHLRYVCVIWFDFHVLQLLHIRFTQWNMCCISKCMMKHQQKLDWKLNLLLFTHGHWKCKFVDFLAEYQNVFTIECEVVNKIWRRSATLVRSL